MRTLLTLCATFVLLGCSSGPTEYVADNSGHLHKVTSGPAQIFQNEVNREANFEAQGLPPSRPSRSWREYWVKVAPYWIGAKEFGTNEQVMAYIEQQRRLRALPPL